VVQVCYAGAEGHQSMRGMHDTCLWLMLLRLWALGVILVVSGGDSRVENTLSQTEADQTGEASRKLTSCLFHIKLRSKRSTRCFCERRPQNSSKLSLALFRAIAW